MRRAADLPRRRRLPRPSVRGVVIALALAVLVVIVFGRALARVYVDALWFDSLGRSDVFWGQLGAKTSLFLAAFGIFLLLAGVNLYLADRAAPVVFPANVHPYVERFHEVFGHRLRIIRYATALVLAFMLALPVTAHWQQWLLYRNRVRFGITDPQFGLDVGFYVFDLPFLTFVVDWLFAVLVIVLLLTLAAHLLNGGVLFTSSAPAVRPATRVHLAALFAVLAAVKAGDYWLSRYELTNDQRGFVQGATYTVVKAQIPALMLLMLIALLTSGLFIWTIRSDRWRLPLVASALWLVVAILCGVLFPAFMQWAFVRPDQAEREATYIARNVAATRAALGIDDVLTVPVRFAPLSADDLEADVAAIQNVRLLNESQMQTRFTADRAAVAGVVIADLDVDRYSFDGGAPEQVLVAARELDLRNVPNTSWQGRHLASTRGCGLVMAPASKVTTQDRPDYKPIALERPELYFSPAVSGYAVANTDVAENSCGDDEDYTGTSGVQMRGALRRGAFALAFLDYNLLGSGSINDDSQMLWIRDVETRVAKLAPFLRFDGDPYPVIVEGGVRWVVDAYTVSSRYPYGQRIGNVQLGPGAELPRDANYIRNSVKAVVDAYTGDVTFFIVDEQDPIVRAWQRAFPDLFTGIDEMPGELRQHLRYPEDLFRVQSEMYSKYQVDPARFFSREGAWSVAQQPSVDRQETTTAISPGADGDQPAVATEFAAESGAARFTPYYTLFPNEETGVNEFVTLRPFVPFSTNDRTTELQAYLTASSDPATYGQLVSYVVDQDTLPPGPLRVADQAESEQAISETLSLQSNTETKTNVKFGDLQVVPVADDGLLYVRPVYVVISGVAELRYVIVSTGTNAVMAGDLRSALAQLFPGFGGDIGDRVDDRETTSTSDEGTTDEAPQSATVEELLADAGSLFEQAERQLRDGDLGAYQATIEEARARVAAALAQLESG